LLKLRAPAGEIQNIGAVFNTWVQQKLKPSAGRAERVYDSLKAANDLRGLGTIGLYLAGKMYRDMDDRTRMVDVYAFATLRCRGPIVVRMHYELAEFWNEFDNRDEARQRYLATAILEPDGWGRRAMVGLAGLALRDGEPKECLTLCKQYLQMREAQARDVLSLMGRAYEQLGKYRAAAECFAGKLPAE
jgi:tetratricopeptide (TPR) repeat protein